MLRKNLRTTALAGSIILSVIAYIIPLTSRVAPDGSYIGIDCDAFAMESIIWYLALACLIAGFLVSRSLTGSKATLKRPLILATAIMLLGSFVLKYSEYREFDAQTKSSAECL